MLGMSRNTVRRLLALSEPPSHGRAGRSRLEPYRATIISMLHHDPATPATVIRDRLAESGYQGGLTAVREFAARIRNQPTVGGVGSAAWETPIENRGSRGGVYRLERVDDADPTAEPDVEPGMNLISADFNIMMVNRVNERLFKKPMVELLGKKCYREFERRDDVCPHCPGLAALTTGHPYQIETRGIRDDGTKYAVRLTAHPIVAPNGDPVGFVEVEEDITERKRSEGLAELVEGLQASLAATHDVTGAVRQALNVAFSLEGVDFGCAYVWDGAAGEYHAVAQRGVSREFAGVLARQAVLSDHRPGGAIAANASSGGVRPVGKGPAAVEVVPIVHDRITVGILLLGSSSYSQFPSATHAAFEALGNIVGSAVASLEALHIQRETVADLEAFLRSLPLPVWGTDAGGRVTLWNQAAERLFGWTAAEVSRPDFPLKFEDTGVGRDVSCRAKDGTPLRLRVTLIPLPRASGAQRRSVHVAEEMPVTPAPQPATSSPEVADPPEPLSRVERPRVLLLDADPSQRRRLARMLREAGCRVAICQNAEGAIDRYLLGLRSARPYRLVIAELLPRAGMGGLEVASVLHRTDPHARVILTSDSHIVGFESHGLAGALRKPYEPEVVRQAIRELLAG